MLLGLLPRSKTHLQRTHMVLRNQSIKHCSGTAYARELQLGPNTKGQETVIYFKRAANPHLQSTTVVAPWMAGEKWIANTLQKAQNRAARCITAHRRVPDHTVRSAGDDGGAIPNQTSGGQAHEEGMSMHLHITSRAPDKSTSWDSLACEQQQHCCTNATDRAGIERWDHTHDPYQHIRTGV